MTKLRSAAIGGALLTSLIAPLLIAAPAHADYVRCSTDTTSGDWRSSCTRSPKDGDAGGVSGAANVIYDNNPKYNARIDFEALGEHSYLYNGTSVKATFVLKEGGIGRWRYILDPGEHKDVYNDFPEWYNVEISVTVAGRGTAANNTLRT